MGQHQKAPAPFWTRSVLLRVWSKWRGRGRALFSDSLRKANQPPSARLTFRKIDLSVFCFFFNFILFFFCAASPPPEKFSWQVVRILLPCWLLFQDPQTTVPLHHKWICDYNLLFFFYKSFFLFKKTSLKSRQPSTPCNFLPSNFAEVKRRNA